jgi:hypothetical protein
MCVTQQVQSWFRRKGALKTSRSKGKAAAATSTFSTGFAKSCRKLQGPELYSKLHYTERIKPVVTERLSTLVTIGKVTRAERLEVIKSVTRDIYEDETEEVKADIAVKVAAA